MKNLNFLKMGFLLLVCAVSTGCVGIGLPHIFQHKPYTLLTRGEKFGRDHLANRYLVASKLIAIEGWEANEVLNILGEPQEIDIQQRNISEDWYFVYYKKYKTWPKTNQGVMLVRFYHDEVIDVIKMN